MLIQTTNVRLTCDNSYLLLQIHFDKVIKLSCFEIGLIINYCDLLIFNC